MKNLFKSQKTFLLIAVVAVLLTGGFIYMQWNKGTSTQGVALLAQGFPILPIYPNAKLLSSTSDPQEGQMYVGIKYSATWEVKKRVPEVTKWYIDKLKNAGWRVDSLPADPNAKDVQLATFDDPSYALSMSFIGGGGGTTKITAEFSTNYKDFCDSSYGKPCTN